MSASRINLSRTALAGLLVLGLASAAHAQRVSRDTQTGELRGPTADEVRTLDAAAARSARPAVGLIHGKTQLQSVRSRNGTVSHELDTSTLMYSVARRNADGSISEYCVTGEGAAKQLVHAPQAKKSAVVSKAAQESSYELK